MARDSGRDLLIIERACEKAVADGITGEARLRTLEGCHDYVVTRLLEQRYEDPEDIFFDEDVDRLVGLVGLSPGKARQIKYSAAKHITELTELAIPLTERELSEPEQRDAQAYDEANEGGGDGESAGEEGAEAAAADDGDASATESDAAASTDDAVPAVEGASA